MDAAAAISVKSLDEKGAAGLGERLQFGFRNIQPAEPCQVMDDLLPCAAVIFIMLGRELGDPQGAIRGLHRRFGPCASQGGARGQKLTQPFFIQAALIVLESDRGVFQRPKVYPRRRRKRFIVRKKFAPFFQAEPQCPHTGFVSFRGFRSSFLASMASLRLISRRPQRSGQESENRPKSCLFSGTYCRPR